MARARSALVEEGDVLLPRQVDHHPQPVLLRGIEQPRGGYRVDADGVEPAAAIWAKSRSTISGEPESAHRGAGRERPVGDAPDPELLVADVEELATDHRSRVGGGGHRSRAHAWGDS